MFFLAPSPPTHTLEILPRSLLTSPPTLGLSATAAAAAPAAPSAAGLADAARHLLATGEVTGPLLAAAPDVAPEAAAPRSGGVHALGVNEAELLEGYAPDEATAMRLQREAASAAAAAGEATVIGQASSGTVQASLTQMQFRLSSVYDPENAEDERLFRGSGAESAADSEESGSEEGGESGGEEGRREAAGMDVGELEEELEAILGGDEAFWSASARQKKRWRARDTATTTNAAEDVWAVEDNVDVSDFASLVPDPAVSWPFELDVFQKRAIYRLERGENVFVAAHTSAGKTVVAEGAIGLARRNRTKVIYTSPIKTLSNQKFRDFTEMFGDVGLITGDVSINPDASVLVMTTEILRSMLYRGADIIRDLEFVVFDEVHWASDPERGVVWEEAIILLPSSCVIVMLSATVPNALEFANWVGRTKQRPVFVVSTHKRPVPLVHSLFIKGEAFPLLNSSKGQFLGANYKAASEKHAALSKNSKVRFGGGRQHAWLPLIKFLRKNELDPGIVFCFSKRKCEEAADSLSSTDLTAGASDKNQIHHFFTSSIARLSPADQRVPQIARCLDTLKRGIGVHHAGILPIVKEVTEVLFQRGLVRILFCTETFAVGVNAPASSVTFSSIRKWDGASDRVLEPGEFVQMSGRAGRRGLDTVGSVFIYPTPADFPSELELKQLLTGAHKRMKSRFRLTYNMILNLMRVDELRVEDVMSRSFSEAPAGRNSARWKQLLTDGERQLQLLDDRGDSLEPFRNFHQLTVQLRSMNEALAPVLVSQKKIASSPLFEAGRIVLVDRGDAGFALAVVIKSAMARTAKLGLRGPSSSSSPGGSTEKICRIALLLSGQGTSESKSPYFGSTSWARSGPDALDIGGVRLQFLDVGSSDVHGFSSLKIAINEQGLNPLRGAPKMEALASAAEQLRAVATDPMNWSALPMLDGGSDVGLKDISEVSLWNQRSGLLEVMCGVLAVLTSSGACGELHLAIRDLDRELLLRQKINQLQVASSDESLQLMPDFRQRVEVLRRLGYTDGGRVLLKGRAMCEVNCCELILVELCFENVLQGMTAPAMAALLSSLVFQGGSGKSVEEDNSLIERLKGVSDELYEGAVELRKILNSVGGVQAECGLPVSPLDYAVSQSNFGLTEAVYAWAKEKPFTEVCQIVPDVAEGTIVRGIVRLSELLREVKSIGRIIGDTSLQELAEDATNSVKRGVIFAASLYVS